VFEIQNIGTVSEPVYANTPTTLVSFNGSDGALHAAGLTADARGDPVRPSRSRTRTQITRWLYCGLHRQNALSHIFKSAPKGLGYLISIKVAEFDAS